MSSKSKKSFYCVRFEDSRGLRLIQGANQIRDSRFWIREIRAIFVDSKIRKIHAIQCANLAFHAISLKEGDFA